jgi:ketosteroid isomerase-like protein
MSDERSFEAALSLFQHRLYKTMGKAKLREVALGGSATDIERAFYDALQKADLEKLMACWADEDEIVCVHPGGVRLVGALEIRKSFESIFSGGSMHVNVLSVRKVESLTSAMHNVIEQIQVSLGQDTQEAYVIATNVYQQTPQGWRMVLHHASPGHPESLQAELDVPSVLH